MPNRAKYHFERLKVLSCIDSLCTSQPNMVMNFGLHASPHFQFHHQVIFAKVDLNFFNLFIKELYGTFPRRTLIKSKKAMNL